MARFFLRSIRLASAIGLMLGLAAAAEPVADLILPPIDGKLSGEFQPLQLTGAPKVRWTLTLASHGENARSGAVEIEGGGSRVQAELELDASGNGTWRVAESRVELKPWLNGALTRGEATVSGEGVLRKGRISGELRVRLRDVDLGEFVRFADAEQEYVKQAKGTVEGELALRLKDNVFSAGASVLSLPAGTVGTIHFVPSPGLLTSYVPAAVLKVYPGIEALEMGVTPLEAKVLRLTYHPDGDAGGHRAVLRIEGRPRDPKIIAPLELDVNFTGPLESLVRKSLDSRLKVGGIK